MSVVTVGRRVDTQRGEDLALRVGELDGVGDRAGGSVSVARPELLELDRDASPRLLGLALGEADQE